MHVWANQEIEKYSRYEILFVFMGEGGGGAFSEGATFGKAIRRCDFAAVLPMYLYE